MVGITNRGVTGMLGMEVQGEGCRCGAVTCGIAGMGTAGGWAWRYGDGGHRDVGLWGTGMWGCCVWGRGDAGHKETWEWGPQVHGDGGHRDVGMGGTGRQGWGHQGQACAGCRDGQP